MKSLQTKFLYALTCASLLASLFITQPVHAASFIVSTPAQLIAAIIAANANASNDVITLNGNITLTAVDNLTAGGNGLPVILADGGSSLIIEGGGFTLSRDGAAPNFRIIDIDAGANVAINDLTITGGNSIFGAGIRMGTGSNLTLDNVEVSGNTSSGRAGGVYNYYATLTIQNGSVIGRLGAPNIGCGGGGIFTEGTAAASTTLDASTVSYNQSPNCAGGGFYMLQDARLVIRNGSVVSNNVGGDPADYPPFASPAGGGGIFGSASPIITISDSTVSNNTVNCLGNPNCGGGGLQGGGSVTITNSTFANNTVNCNTSTPCGGGGIYNYATLNITNSTFSGNSTGGDGGGIYNRATLTITNSTLSGNSAAYGGGINNQSVLTITGSTLANNSATNNGGGIYNINSLSITDSAVDSNAAALLGGGILNASPGSTFTKVTFSNNTALTGAGLANDGGTPSITNVTFSNNQATNAGGMYNYNSYPTLTNVTFNGNGASANGGGLYNSNPSSSTLFNVIIANSTSGGDCYNLPGGSVDASSSNNLIESTGANACGLTNGVNGNIVGTDPNLGPLANNGGSTQTLALLAGSPAIDTGTNTGCPAADQRGVVRPQNSTCDIGAYELDTSYPTVVSDSLVASYTTGPSSFTVTFSENVYDPSGNTNADDVTNPANYLLVENGVNNIFNTTSCAGGLVSDDTQTTVTSVAYDGVNTATVNLGSALPSGTYRLFVCGTTSIVDPALNELNNGASDYTFNFVVGAPTTTTTTSASLLPATGFAPNRLTSLQPQPANLAYTSMGDIWLEIPSLNVKTDIVGVPKANGSWSVDWLGKDTGWLNGTAFPTWEGNSVITGHVYNASGLPGPFANLKNLKYGDQIIVHLYGQKYIFEVTKTTLVTPSVTSFAYRHLEDASYLTLITCQGYDEKSDTYLYRQVVRAVLVNVQWDK